MQESGTIHNITSRTKRVLKSLYPPEEIQSFIFILCEHYLGYSKTDVLSGKNSRIDSEAEKDYFKAVDDLVNNKPIQYILGETIFYELSLKVDTTVLIPRPETEEMVQTIIQNLGSQSLRILDIGTGSGCIAIALAKELSESEVFAVDVSFEALRVAKENAIRNSVKVTFMQGDILHPEYNNFPDFDIIVSNPPYIPYKEEDDLPKNISQFEPSLALFVENEEPLIFYEQIADFSIQKLFKNGWLYFEIHEKFGNIIKHMLHKKGFFNITLSKDLNGKERFIKAQK